MGPFTHQNGSRSFVDLETGLDSESERFPVQESEEPLFHEKRIHQVHLLSNGWGVTFLIVKRALGTSKSRRIGRNVRKCPKRVSTY